MRCLKRRISDAIYRQLVADAQAAPAQGHGRGPGRAPRGVSNIQRGRLAPAHRHFGSATSRTRNNDATPDLSDQEAPTARTLQTVS
jgi:transposase